MTWILPKQLHTLASALDTEALSLDSSEQSQVCAQSLFVRSKPSPSAIWLRKWRRDSWTQHLSGRILRPSLGQRFATEWTSSLGATHANPSVQQGSAEVRTTRGTCGPTSQTAFDFSDLGAASLRTSKDISRWGCPTSSKTWQEWVIERRGAYSARLNAEHRTNASGCSSWPTMTANEAKNSQGGSQLKRLPPPLGTSVLLAHSTSQRGSTGIPEQEPRYERTAGESHHGGYQAAWPSRPGEQQYGWEPPRVVGNTESEQDRGLQQPGVQADAASAGPEPGDTGCERQEERQVEAGRSKQSDEVRDVADSSIIRCDRRPDGSCRWSGESGEAGVDATGSGSEGDGLRQAEPPLGGDPDGPAGGLDYAQLCVTCDNRTDELRLLGNGVVPATAERAFRTLIKELDDSDNSR